MLRIFTEITDPGSIVMNLPGTLGSVSAGQGSGERGTGTYRANRLSRTLKYFRGLKAGGATELDVPGRDGVGKKKSSLESGLKSTEGLAARRSIPGRGGGILSWPSSGLRRSTRQQIGCAEPR